MKYVLFVKGGREDGEALRLLREVLGDELVVIDVREGRAGGWMLWEYGSDETPLLATPTGVYYGLEAIKGLVRGMQPPPKVVSVGKISEVKVIIKREIRAIVRRRSP